MCLREFLYYPLKCPMAQEGELVVPFLFRVENPFPPFVDMGALDNPVVELLQEDGFIEPDQTREGREND